MDIPRIFNITESAHRIHNPFTPEKFATLGAALRLESETRVLDLGSGSGEMLCTWARDHGVIGTGIDMSRLFTEQAKIRAAKNPGTSMISKVKWKKEISCVPAYPAGYFQHGVRRNRPCDGEPVNIRSHRAYSAERAL